VTIARRFVAGGRVGRESIVGIDREHVEAQPGRQLERGRGLPAQARVQPHVGLHCPSIARGFEGPGIEVDAILGLVEDVAADPQATRELQPRAQQRVMIDAQAEGQGTLTLDSTIALLGPLEEAGEVLHQLESAIAGPSDDMHVLALALELPGQRGQGSLRLPAAVVVGAPKADLSGLELAEPSSAGQAELGDVADREHAEIEVALGMNVGPLVDRDALDLDLEIVAMHGIEAAQEVLLALALGAMLNQDQAGDQTQRILGGADRDRPNLLGREGDRAGRVRRRGHDDLARVRIVVVVGRGIGRMGEDRARAEQQQRREGARAAPPTRGREGVAPAHSLELAQWPSPST
jgi:hypothetical protein